MDLEGRVALVTGAARGIGAATARRMAQAGAGVALCDVDAAGVHDTAARIAAETGQVAEAFVADVTDATSVQQLVDGVQARFGQLSILVNNAGVLRNAPLADMSEADWDLVIDVHLKGAFLCSRAVAPLMTALGWGRILSLSSGAARGSTRGHASYSAAKAGIVGLTRTLALELGPAGVTCNAVAPGVIASDMTRATAAQVGMSWGAYLREVEGRVALRRIGAPEEVADVLCFLASDAARYVSGETIFVGGGPGP